MGRLSESIRRLVFKRQRRGQQELSVVRAVDRDSKITVRDAFTAFSLALFEPISKRLVRTFEMDRIFARAGLSVHPVKYGAETMSVTVLVGIISAVGFTLFYLVSPLPLMWAIVGAIVVAIFPVSVFTLRLLYPYIVASSRKIETENELPFFMAYVATMVRGGYSLEKVVERVAQLRIFKAIRREARRVLTRVKMMGDDPITALEAVASSHPSTKFRDIMLGYTTTLRSGGDVVHYLEIRTRELFEYRTAEIKNIVGRLMSFLEVYTIFGVIVSITLFVFFAVSAAITAAQAMRTPGELTPTIDVTLPSLYNFIVLPALGLIIALAIHLNQPRTPVGYAEAYITLAVWLPISVAAFIFALVVTGSVEALYGDLNISNVKSLVYAISAGLVTASLPPALKYSSIVKRRRGLIGATADFLRDISEIRKTGLSPERCIILVSSRNYRTLTLVVERVAAALSIGLSLEEALRRALKGVKEWFVIASLRFLADSIIVGGGAPEVIDTLARFTQVLSELEEETRRRMRAQAIMPYLGATLLASMPMIILYMLLSLAKIPIAAVTPLVFALCVGSLLNSYIMGLIAGKASQATVAAGFFHSIVLVLVTVATITATFAYIGA